MPDFAGIAAAIAAACGKPLHHDRVQELGGGSISRAWRIDGADGHFFVKTNCAEFAANFAAEADGLDALAAAVSPAPTFVAMGVVGVDAFLALRFLDLGRLGGASGMALGRQLAALHRQRGEHFGWRRDNFIGATPQSNTPHVSWPHFFARQRLLPQLELASRKGFPTDLRKQGDAIVERVGGLFIDYHPTPSLLHGDLWSGNAAQLPDGQPVMFDPACYYGDRETDLAMSELFGGFPESFYAAYREAWPLDRGYESRKPLYNLYHILNHFNLFGAAYLGQARRMIERLHSGLRR
jgi:fructosamine-3-kinase